HQEVKASQLASINAQADLNRFTFERGANAGSFMHLVLELIDFTKAQIALPQQLPKAMQQYAIAAPWQGVLEAWYLDLLQAPLLPSRAQAPSQDDNPLGGLSDGLTLSKLAPNQTLVEMEFYLPLQRMRDAELNALLEQYGYHSRHSFDELQGMLKGFIDLTFEYQGKFYIADYKSNHLGDSISAYHGQALKQAIIEHSYDLQYIIYSLALHRYLQLRLTDYDYDVHMGGCYYLFLRGMSSAYPGCGVYYDKPPKALILALDSLLRSGTEHGSRA
ncbi:MAG: exodeoxyribonuclease V subunit beta, partial [Shewanella sp.]